LAFLGFLRVSDVRFAFPQRATDGAAVLWSNADTPVYVSATFTNLQEHPVDTVGSSISVKVCARIAGKLVF